MDLWIFLLYTGSMIHGEICNKVCWLTITDRCFAIFCTKMGLWLTGNFWERLQAASSYRAEMLGLCFHTSLQGWWQNSFRYKGGRGHCAVTMNKLWSYHLTSKVGYIQAPNAQTSGGTYGQPNRPSKLHSDTFTCTATWTSTSHGTN